ncbi:hypothetical protein BKA82DRAFT_4012999 [Pisolithus tinctorius]|nr:hypothetical protein BKA82DRAFT_4012999 [Pisolithus tinctorius]
MWGASLFLGCYRTMQWVWAGIVALKSTGNTQYLQQSAVTYEEIWWTKESKLHEATQQYYYKWGNAKICDEVWNHFQLATSISFMATTVAWICDNYSQGQLHLQLWQHKTMQDMQETLETCQEGSMAQGVVFVLKHFTYGWGILDYVKIYEVVTKFQVLLGIAY